ncbi:hypothetical protein ACIBSW_03895 [Actinoplanes sp. NPDC049668]|uniref:hypothetical protein n=1 Tax=unclassified Actinoplanes TaxID=2626549 RepID=UPI0033AA2213
MINEKLRLSIGAPPAQKIVGAVFGLLFAAGGAAFVALPLLADNWLGTAISADESCPSADELAGIPEELLPESVRDCLSNGSWFTGFDTGFDDGVGAMRLIGLLGIPFVLVGLYLALSALRTAAWLEGTRATVRRAFRARTVDLATATITVGALAFRRNRETTRETIERIPTLIARDPAGGPTVTIPLHGIGMAQLPPPELRALADAIAANPDRDARNLAAQLRTMADNPLGVLVR